MKNTLKGHEEWVRSVSLNSKGDLLASSCDDEKIFIWQTGTNTVQHELYGHSNKIECVIFLKNEKAVYNVYTSDYASENKLGVNENENKEENKESNEKDDLAKINAKILKKQQLLNDWMFLYWMNKYLSYFLVITRSRYGLRLRGDLQ